MGREHEREREEEIDNDKRNTKKATDSKATE